VFTLRAVGNLKARSSRDGSLIQSYRIPRSAIQVSSVDPCPGINDLTECHHLQQLCECWSWWSFFQVVSTAKWHQKHGMLTCCMCFRCEMFFVFNRWVLGFVLILEWHEICWNRWPDEIAYFILLSQGFPHPDWKRHIVRPEKTCIGTAQSYFAVLTVLLVCMFMPLCLRQESMMHVESTSHPEPWVTETLDPYHFALRC